MIEPKTAGDLVRSWASDPMCDPDMAPVLDDLASRIDRELSAAVEAVRAELVEKASHIERDSLSPAAELLGCEAEVFAVLAAVRARNEALDVCIGSLTQLQDRLTAMLSKVGPKS